MGSKKAGNLVKTQSGYVYVETNTMTRFQYQLTNALGRPGKVIPRDGVYNGYDKYGNKVVLKTKDGIMKLDVDQIVSAAQYPEIKVAPGVGVLETIPVIAAEPEIPENLEEVAELTVVEASMSGKEPKFNAAVFADGKDVSVFKKNGLIMVQIGDEVFKYTGTTPLSIFGGAKEAASTHEGTQSIRISGDVKIFYVVAGGLGGRNTGGTKADSTGDVAISIRNGARVSEIHGGGAGCACLKGHTTINIGVGAFCDIVYGGAYGVFGAPAPTEMGSTESELDSATIVVDGEVNFLHGGAFSMGAVGSAEVVVNGTVNYWTIAAGSNGYVGHASITIADSATLNAVGGTDYAPYALQGAFRGNVGTVVMTIESDATINGDICIGTNALKDDDQTAKITDSLNLKLVGKGRRTNINLGAGEDGTSLNDCKAITIQGNGKISRKKYVDVKDTELHPITITKLVTMTDGAEWEMNI